MKSLDFTHGKSTVRYSPDTGEFRWVCAYRKPWLSGATATQPYGNGYLNVTLGGKTFTASRLAWTLVNGEIPAGHVVDHINGDKTDNRISNLRAVAQSQNLVNRAATGVSWFAPRGLYRARCRNKTRYAKTYDEALRLRDELVREVFA